jgi:hypothetical protein
LLSLSPPPCCGRLQFKDEPAALKLKHDAAGVVGFANSGKKGQHLLHRVVEIAGLQAWAVCPVKPSLKESMYCFPPPARAGKHSNTSQFYITFAAAPPCDQKHVVVGRVVQGLDVLQQIGETGEICASAALLPCPTLLPTCSLHCAAAGDRSLSLLLPAGAEDLAASSDGTPRTDVVCVDCGQL